ncbi:hypothetical protein SYNTR_1215 [Candidatus Syntrophocurvum alkaliphilum]|uniref:Uncharacterized protein n=1 Tax=Candidatus Syntrophocurvum alkaliphilum TaxID=2293317 RepID=A0A6I6DAH0_9FIRM|nr:DUF1887 family CARF protein [Candidatus Syntrophocurvum alkaliphilum]QGT99808.1 hypothetical protein SYNTR_1215 [Candidatus Syntrophocurvum alkaliphilum]
MTSKKYLSMIILISDQTIPNLLSVMHYRPNTIYFIHSKEERMIKLKNDLKTTISEEIDEVKFIEKKLQTLDPTSSYNTCLEILKNENQKTIINVTGGTKLMSFGAFQAGFEMDAHIIYVNTDNNCFLNMRTGDIDGYLPKLSIHHFIRLRGKAYDETLNNFLKEKRPHLEQIINDIVNMNDKWKDFCKYFNKEDNYNKTELLIPSIYTSIIFLLSKVNFIKTNKLNINSDHIECIINKDVRHWFFKPYMPSLIYSFYKLMNHKNIDDIGINNYSELYISTNSQLNIIRYANDYKATTEYLNSIENEARNIAGIFTNKTLVMDSDISRKDKFQKRASRMGINILKANIVNKYPEKIIEKVLLPETPSRQGVECMVLLISDQIIPNYLAVLKFKPRNIYFIFTEEFRFIKLMENLSDTIKNKLPNTNIYIRVTDSFDATVSYKISKEIINEYGNNNTIINATTGTKPMSFGVLQAGVEKNSHIIYVDTQNGVILNTGQTDLHFLDGNDLLPKLIIDDYIKLCRVKIKSEETTEVLKHEKTLREYVDLVFKYIESWRAIFSRINNPELLSRIDNKLLSGLKKLGIVNKYEIKDNKKPELEETNSFSNYKSILKKEGTPLELYTYFTVKDFPEVDDIKVSLSFDWSLSDIDPPNNELDVVLSCNSRLTIISCKIGNWQLNALEELEVYGDLLGGTFVNKILVYYNEPKNNFTDLKETAIAMRIKLIKYSDIKHDYNILKKAIL